MRASLPGTREPYLPPTAPLALRLPREVYTLDGADSDSRDDVVKARRALESMKRSLRGWLKYRRLLDRYVSGQRPAPVLFRNPGAAPLPPAVIATTLDRERYPVEQDMAETLHALLSEAGLDTQALPAPDVAQDPDAAVKLAAIALRGHIPSAAHGPAPQGVIWFVLAIPILGVVLVIGQMIKSKADVAKEKEKLRCIESGACTDSGFWLKVAAIATVGWLAWDKFGLRESVAKRKKAR